MGTMMVENLFGKLCSLITLGAQKLVHYVHKMVKATYEYISTKVSENLSRLRNVWTLLEACLSSAMNYIKEKCLPRIRFTMRWIMLLFKWLYDQLVELFAGFKNASKTAAKSAVKSVNTLIKKTTIFTQDTLLPALQKTTDGNDMVELAQAFSDYLFPLLGLMTGCFEEVCGKIDDDKKTEAKNK